MGDIVHALPLAENARRAGVEVGWVTERAVRAGSSRATPPSRGSFSPTRGAGAAARSRRRAAREIRRLRAELREFAPDATIDAQGLWKSALLARLAGAPVVSLGARDRREHDLLAARRPPVRLDPAAVAHVVDQNLALLAPLGIPVASRRPGRPVPPRAPAARGRRVSADALRAAVRPLPSRRRAARRSPGARSSFAALAPRLARKRGPRARRSPGDRETRSAPSGSPQLLPDAPRIPALDFAGPRARDRRARALFVARRHRPRPPRGRARRSDARALRARRAPAQRSRAQPALPRRRGCATIRGDRPSRRSCAKALEAAALTAARLIETGASGWLSTVASRRLPLLFLCALLLGARRARLAPRRRRARTSRRSSARRCATR